METNRYCFLLALLVTLFYLLSPADGQTADALQAVLNRFCISNPDHQGCHQLPPQVGVTGPDGCPVGSLRCPDNVQYCLPEDISCGLIGSRESCTLPSDPRVDVQTLICGDGSTGVRCGTAGQVPVLSEVLVQCRGDNSPTGDSNAVNSLGPNKLLTGEAGGVGIYRCLPGQQWQPTYEGSPFLFDLLKSCYFAGCGRIPSPAGNSGINQSWPFVREVLDSSGKFLCTGTLVADDALLTAAHCVTSSSAVPVNADQRRVSLAQNRVRQTIQSTSIHIHRRYSGSVLRDNDLAIVKFQNNLGETFPHACIPPQDLPSTRPSGVIFQYEDRFGGPSSWRISRASLSPSCSSRQSVSCSVTPQEGQFCATQANFKLGKGSSGGPYLINVSPSLDFIWSVYGVYSREHAPSSNCNPNNVYIDTALHRRWIEECVLNNNCQ